MSDYALRNDAGSGFLLRFTTFNDCLLAGSAGEPYRDLFARAARRRNLGSSLAPLPENNLAVGQSRREATRRFGKVSPALRLRLAIRLAPSARRSNA